MSRIEVTANSEVLSSIHRAAHQSAPATVTARPRYQSHGGSGISARATVRPTPNSVTSSGLR